VSTGRSIHAVSSITPSPTEGIEDGLAEGRPEDPRAKASAEIDVAAVTVERSPQTGPERPLRAADKVSLNSAVPCKRA
jgi:hypothetical protein